MIRVWIYFPILTWLIQVIKATLVILTKFSVALFSTQKRIIICLGILELIVKDVEFGLCSLEGVGGMWGQKDISFTYWINMPVSKAPFSVLAHGL